MLNYIKHNIISIGKKNYKKSLNIKIRFWRIAKKLFSCSFSTLKQFMMWHRLLNSGFQFFIIHPNTYSYNWNKFHGAYLYHLQCTLIFSISFFKREINIILTHDCSWPQTWETFNAEQVLQIKLFFRYVLPATKFIKRPS